MDNFLVPSNYYKLYSSYGQSLQVIKYIKYHLLDLNTLIITDSTGGIGGNSLLFCKNFAYVNIIEIDKRAIWFLNNNLLLHNNKTIIHSNYINLIHDLKQDAVFIDPPWGDNYKINANPSLFINDTNVVDIISHLYDKSKIVILKAPLTYRRKRCNKWILNVYTIRGNCKDLYSLFIYHK